MKKLLAILISLCLTAVALFAFASCGSDESKDDGSEETKKTTETVGSVSDGSDGTQGGSTDNTQGGSTDNTQGGSTDNTQGGSTDNTQGGNTDNTQGGSTDNTQGGNTDDDDTERTTITYEEWVATINLKNFTMSDSILGMVYRVTEDAMIIDSESDYTLAILFKDGCEYAYMMDPNGHYYFVEKIEESEGAPTLGMLLDFTDASTYYELYYVEEDGCYFFEGYRFVFENGLLVEFNYSTDIDYHGTTVLVELPEFNEGDINGDDDGDEGDEGDNEVRTEITVDEWNEMRNLGNFTLDMGSGVIYYITENAMKVILDDYVMIQIRKDGYIYIYETDDNGELDFVEKQEAPAEGTSIGRFLLEEFGYNNEETFYNLRYSSDDKCYYISDKSLRFENGLLVSYCGSYTFTNHNETVIEDLPEINDEAGDEGGSDEIRTEITYEDWCKLFEVTNFTQCFDFLESYTYCSDNVSATYNSYNNSWTYIAYKNGFEIVITVDSEGNLVIDSFKSSDVDKLSLGALIFGKDACTEEYFNSFSYYAPTGRYTKDYKHYYFENGYLVNFDDTLSFSDFGTTVIENLPDINRLLEGALEGGLTLEQWASMVNTDNFRAVMNSKDVTFVDSDKLYFYSSSETYYMYNESGTTYYVYYKNGEYYRQELLYDVELTIGGVIGGEINDFFSLYYDSSLGCYVIHKDVDGKDDEYQFYFTDGVITKIINYYDSEYYEFDIYDIGETAVAIPEYKLS